MILALETSSRLASVAVLRGGELLSTGQTRANERSAAALAPLLQSSIAAANVQLEDIDLVAVTIGPGSFTGLRVGVTTAKTLAYACKCEVLGVGTLEAIAWQVPPEVKSVWTVLDAQRQQLFVARFVRDASAELRVVEPTSIVDADAFITALSPDEHVCGPGVERIRERLPAGSQILPVQNWHPQAETVGRLALQQYQDGRRDDLWKLAPLYFRPSAAEEKWASRHK